MRKRVTISNLGLQRFRLTSARCNSLSSAVGKERGRGAQSGNGAAMVAHAKGSAWIALPCLEQINNNLELRDDEVCSLVEAGSGIQFYV